MNHAGSPDKKAVRSHFFRNRRLRLQQDRASLAGLQFEKCEPRHMLSAVSVFEFGNVVETGQERLIRNYLADSDQAPYLQSGPSDLQLVDFEKRSGGMAVQFQQTMDGIPVHGAFVTVLQDKGGEILDLDNRGFIHLPTQDQMVPELAVETARQIANQGFGARADLTNSSELVWFSNGNFAELAWQVETVVAGANVNGADLEFTTVVDANSGSVLSRFQSPSHTGSLPGETEIGIFPRIVINDAIGGAGSRAYAAGFDSVVALALGCTGTLMAPNVVISARHCGAGAGSQIIFGDNSNAGIHTAVVQSSFLPDGNGSLLDGGDVAILTLTADVPSAIATPMRFIDATSALEGQLAATVGYGYNGIGSVGHQNSADGWRWGGENIIDVYGSPANSSGSNIISTDFDDGSSGANTIPGGSATPLNFEATTAPGDSGGPVMVQIGSEWVIAGVLSGGTTGNSVYGDISWWTGTAVYRAEIETRGGVFADGGLGSVSFDQSVYFIGDTVSINVSDSNAIPPISVTVESDSGDSETFNLTGSGSFYSGSIVTSDAAVSVGDGTLQVSADDQITVTYVDPDDGEGNSDTLTSTASVLELGIAGLTAVDFDTAGGTSPNDWLRIGSGGDTTFNNLADESGAPTAYDLAIAELTDGNWTEFAVTPAANTIPLHPNSIGNIGGQIYTGADPLQLTWSDLTPSADYEIYILAAEGFYSSIEQTVTISGDGAPVTFDQVFNSDQLFVNDQLGDSSRNLSEYAQIITANGSGQIVIDITPISGTQDVVLAGVAINAVPGANLLEPIADKLLDGTVAAGQLADTAASDDVYYQLLPSATSNPVKQRVEIILLAEYDGGSPGSFSFIVEASMNGGPAGDVMQTIELWNDQTDSWEQIFSDVATTGDSVTEVTPMGDYDRFIHPLTGEVLSRVRWDSPSFSGTPFNWNIEVDQLGWSIA